ncbi:hypothetical protein POM88_036057 [Heracleum sosnowskyi]|uniref:Uncharacterized protein n=1 Tax=Heracleum sosnowskyi TaxID=360622 RepID=A0AAD8HP29_9APIA|nr:hypothetical protein POM88_036048 [Heracleum sosnowskyi]KAK1369959.1 hypothetical protein POM88_036051 [Heracleum sosnowskyi]KAK1369962.1 hypothetical protein POM88_036054 [Heracleum sosnowskyi]KAK1369965.1 hypothetical protein POM88_036057 [Heracleum sosnowskyi]
MGLGIDHPDFRDVTDPVNFDVALGLVDGINILSVGQGNAPQAVHHEVEMNAGHQVEGGEQEVLQGGAAANNEAFLFAGDLPLDDNDQVLVALLSTLAPVPILLCYVRCAASFEEVGAACICHLYAYNTRLELKA